MPEIQCMLVEESIAGHAMTAAAIAAQIQSQKIVPSILTIPEKDSEAVNRAVRLAARASEDDYQAGKRVLVLRNARGHQFRSCPGAQTKDGSRRLVCCNYYVLNFLSGCPFSCTYCYLGSYLNQYALSLQVNMEEPLSALFAVFAEHPSQFFRVGTGEIADSLALPASLPVNRFIVQEFSRRDNVLLELKTKSARLDGLLDLDPRQKTVISWSISPPRLSALEEHDTAPIEARLAAAKQALAHGYRVAFHLDPLLYMHQDWPSWEREYDELLEMIFSSVPPRRIEWLSLGGLRLIKGLREMMLERSPESRLPYQEFVLGPDGKWRYPKPIRKKMFQYLSKRIESRAGKEETPPVYLCMESREIWDSAMGGIPETQGKLRSIFSHAAPRPIELNV